MIAPPDKRLRHLGLTLALAALIVALLVFANRHYLFHSEEYEGDDMAANALSILRAEHFHQVYGQYSRWGFRHPGPAMFYWLGWGEKIFYQWWHLVPTPLNAQVLAAVVMFGCFLAVSLGTAARWVRSAFFLPLAMLAAVLHFTGVDTTKCLTSVWPPFEMVMPFVLLLAAAASVMAGAGDDLPLLALAGCLLIHLHVAQPLFVLPTFALAYAGLAWACRGQRPWRAYRRAHGFALAVAVAFVLPVVFDLFRGSHSNLHLILDHVRLHSGEERHSWLDSVYYFLRFGVYKPSLDEYVFRHHAERPAVLHLFGTNVATTELGQFLGMHLRMMAIWLGAVLLIIVAGVRRWRYAGATASPAGRWRFLICLGVVWALSVGLTLVWGCVQDGEMFYFNAWFDYGIYFALALIAVGALADSLEIVAENSPRPRLWVASVAAVCVLGATARIVTSPGRYVREDDPERVAQARTVFAALAEATPDARLPKLLVFSQTDWDAAAAAASLLERRGVPFRVMANWSFMLGDEYGLKDLSPAMLQSADGAPRFDFWRFIPAAETPALTIRRPMAAGNALMIGSADLDPNPGASIDFVGDHANSDLYTLLGFAPAQPGDTYVWTEGDRGLVYFHARPVPTGSAVEITCDFGSNEMFDPGAVQRLALHYNGTDLGTQRIVVGAAVSEQTPLKFLVPAALWNQHSDALLDLGFPDTVSPLEKKRNRDHRQLGFVSRRITFRVVPAADAPPSS